MAKKIKRSVSDFPELEAWLDQHQAFCLWSVEGGEFSPSVSGWRVGAGVAIVLLYATGPSGARGGWGIATEPDTIDVKQTLADVEGRLGITKDASS